MRDAKYRVYATPTANKPGSWDLEAAKVIVGGTVDRIELKKIIYGS